MRKMTVKQLAEAIGVEYLMASSLVKLMVSKGVAKAVDKLPSEKGKGKPSVIYEIPDSFEISLV